MLAPDTIYFILASLLVLSIITIALCKKETFAPTSYAEFLFMGKTFFHSVVSSAGAVFSVTYLLGATFIYATIYRAWTFLMAGAVVVVAFLLVRRIIYCAAKEIPPDPSLSGKHNILLRFMQQRLSESNFLTFIRLLALAFFLLLVEELAISRLVLSSLMRGVEPLGSILLFIIVAVVFAYLYIGGFRALINSDIIQGSVIAAFLSVLAYYVSKRGPSLRTLAQPPDFNPWNLAAATILWTFYGCAFLTMAVDLFSRLNFAAPKDLLNTMRVRFVAISFLLMLVVVTAGIGFGLAISTELGTISSASNYYANIVNFFATADPAAIQVIFVVALFCMVFTTIDTLLLTVMQIRFYGKGVGSQRADLSRVLVLAVGCSVFVDGDAVCAFGIFVGSILVLPFVQVLGQLFSRFPFTPAKSHHYLWFSLVLAAVAVVQARSLFLENFEIHYVIPGLILLTTFLSGIVAATVERLLRRSTS